tara:strand:+ start:990 stop:1310 length:321 start_codon:yes stop_codon:yes gene_type:complete
MIKKYLKYQIIIFMAAALSAPISFAYETTNNNHFICKYGVDNTTDKSNFFVHCDKCVYFYDTDNLAITSQIFLKPTLIIKSSIVYKEDNIEYFIYSNYQSRSPPSV